jgi:hypothetical protein
MHASRSTSPASVQQSRDDRNDRREHALREGARQPLRQDADLEAFVGDGIRALHIARDRREHVLRLIERHAGFEAAVHRQAPRRAVGEQAFHPWLVGASGVAKLDVAVHLRAGIEPVERLRHDADDGRRRPIEPHHFAEHRAISAKALHPERIAEDNARVRSLMLAVARRKPLTERRRDAKAREIVVGDAAVEERRHDIVGLHAADP